MNQYIILLVLLCAVLASLTDAQARFNAFKSYRNEKIKPPHYAKKEITRHPIHEYLSDNQVRMMKHRKSERHHPDATYKETWSGFDKDRRLEEILTSPESEESSPTFNSAYAVALCLVFMLGSVAWVAYIFFNRQHSVRKISAAVKDEIAETKLPNV
jgi:hypothetical protein